MNLEAPTPSSSPEADKLRAELARSEAEIASLRKQRAVGIAGAVLSFAAFVLTNFTPIQNLLFPAGVSIYIDDEFVRENAMLEIRATEGPSRIFEDKLSGAVTTQNLPPGTYDIYLRLGKTVLLKRTVRLEPRQREQIHVDREPNRAVDIVVTGFDGPVSAGSPFDASITASGSGTLHVYKLRATAPVPVFRMPITANKPIRSKLVADEIGAHRMAFVVTSNDDADVADAIVARSLPEATKASPNSVNQLWGMTVVNYVSD